MKNNVSKLFCILAILYITLILTSNILAGRMILLGNISLTGATIVFPITYILGDVFTEVYGFKQNKSLIWITFICNLIMSLCFVLVINMPYPDAFSDYDSYRIVLGTTPKVLAASMLGLLLGNFSNSIIMSKLKVLTNGKYLALRTISSTIVGEIADTSVFLFIIFMGILPNEVLVNMILYQSIAKILIEILFTPITYKVISKIKKIEGIDTYDYELKYKII